MKIHPLLFSLVYPGLLALAVLLPLPAAAQSEIKIEQSPGPVNWLTHNYRPRTVPGIDLNNSPRLESLIRSGNLYLTAEDAVALAIENNLDIEVQRYAPLLQAEVLRRAQSGGALRSVGQGVAAGPQSVSLTGVSLNSGGATAGTGGNGVSSGGGIVTQLGPSLLSLDPTVSVFANFAHTTSPQSNTFLSGTTSLVTGTRSFNASYSQNWVYGLSAQLTYSANHTNVNSKLFALNPYTSGALDLQVTQNLLQGFGASVNGRNIRVQKNNIKVTDLQFKQQLITTVSAVLNLYWDLVSFNQDVRARQRELDAAQQLLQDNRRQVDLGTLAEIEITRAESQVYTAQQDLVVSQTNLLQQETVLKNALVRDGIARANLGNIRVIPLGQLTVPASGQAPDVDQLVQEALSKRPEIETNRINIQSNQLNLVGIKNSLKPSLQAFAELTNNALAGVAANPAAEIFAGGPGLFLSQIFQRNYPNYSAGISFSIAIRNRAAQSDYVTSQLELRQNELSLRKSVNQVSVDVENAVIGLQQALARYQAALKARDLSQQTLDADQERLRLGVSTPYQVVTDQQALASSISTETQALANYSHARISFDQAMGRTLAANNISTEDALTGRVSRTSVLPAVLPTEATK
ncbi:MAG TPA: TolC family protein [Bryobacteraceae bacterium]|jgi:outer membrane protein TolC